MTTGLHLSICLAVLGFLLTTRKFLTWYNNRNPLTGLLIYYTILITAILILQHFGLIIAGIQFNTWRHLLGTILIMFSFFIVVSWESCYINQVTRGNCNNVSTIYLASEDGAVYYLWSKLFPLAKDHERNRILTYIVTPFVLSLIGSFLITEKIEIGPF